MKKIRERNQWDIFVRISHWSLVLLVIGAFISSEDGESIHITIGYAILALVALRIVWGFIGTKNARFKDFVKGPGPVFSYLKGLLTGKHREYSGHNPAGGAMIVAILATLIMTGFTGMMTVGAEGMMEEVHELFAGLLIFLVCVHVASVLLMWGVYGENLIKPMITGNRVAREQE